MSGWIALGRAAAGWRGILIEGSQIRCDVQGADEAVLVAQLGGGVPVLRLGEGVPDKLPARVVPTGAAGFSGLIQDRPPDVLGGWGRLWLAGYLAVRPGWGGVVVLCEGGTRHWLHLSAGEVVSMQGVLTPRLQAALGGAGMADAGAVADTMSRPERLAAQLHAAEISGQGEVITGHLIGAELAAARVYWLGQEVAVVGGTADPMAEALRGQGVPVELVDPEDLVGPGLVAIGAALGFPA